VIALSEQASAAVHPDLRPKFVGANTLPAIYTDPDAALVEVEVLTFGEWVRSRGRWRCPSGHGRLRLGRRGRTPSFTAMN
jgi:hypothetical protein